MGALLCKRSCCSHCCCCRCCYGATVTPARDADSGHRFGALPVGNFKVLLLGQHGSGKTEVGHALVRSKRSDYEPTNGVQYYRLPLAHLLATAGAGQLAITEVGGNDDMQKIWPHYYVTAMGIIYCFDLSTAHEEMWQTFEHLRRLLSHPFVRGKPVLLVATKTEDIDSGVQLYDIENAFQLEALARTCGSSIRLCCHECRRTSATAGDTAATLGRGSLQAGIRWLAKYLLENWCILSIRIKCDENAKTRQQQQQKTISNGISTHKRPPGGHNSRRGRRFLRYSNHNRSGRPQTAPPSISATIMERAHRRPHAQATRRANENEATTSSAAVPNINSTEKLITDV